MNSSRATLISGEWISGPNAGQRAAISDVRAGLIYTVGSEGSKVIGTPEQFRADTGEAGSGLMTLLLPWPRVSTLFRGAVREALAAAHSLARIGRQDTRRWDLQDRYIVDDNEGNTAAIQFPGDACIGGARSHDPSRLFDQTAAVAVAPGELREALSLLCKLPLFESGGDPKVTAAFWSTGGLLSGPEPWYKSYLFGAEILRRELQHDEIWEAEAAEQYELSRDTAMVITRIAGRARTLQPVMLKPQELALVIPHDSPHADEALDELVSGERFYLSVSRHD